MSGGRVEDGWRMTTMDPDTDGYTDGNELAGPLSEIFAVDVTAAVDW
jgi:hypothetical protein